MRTILVTGGSGFIGRHFCAQAVCSGFGVIVISRDVPAAKQILPNAVQVLSDLDELPASTNIDVIVNLAGEPLAKKRWSEKRKQLFYTSRGDFTERLFNFFALRDSAPETLISGSAIGYYGPGSEPMTESSDYLDGFSHQLCAHWEASARRFEKLGTRVCLIRTGIVLGDHGALAEMLPPFKLGLGGVIGSGQQYMSWIHVQDMVALLMHCIETQKLSGPINATAPNPLRNYQFVKILARVLRRPAVLPMPKWLTKLLFGEMGEELLLQGQQVLPEKATQSGFVFMFPDLKLALEDIIL